MRGWVKLLEIHNFKVWMCGLQDALLLSLLLADSSSSPRSVVPSCLFKDVWVKDFGVAHVGFGLTIK